MCQASTGTGHAWLRRYGGVGGLANLADRSSRPAWCPHQMSPVTEARVVALRGQHPGWGPTRIRYQLGKEDVDPLPGRSSVYRALDRTAAPIAGHVSAHRPVPVGRHPTLPG